MMVLINWLRSSYTGSVCGTIEDGTISCSGHMTESSNECKGFKY